MTPNLPPEHEMIPVERVQIGARMEKRLLKVLRALADYYDLSLGDLLEGIVLHVFESKLPFDEEALEKVAQLKAVYKADYGASASHHFVEPSAPTPDAPHKAR
ncbi:MAG TPA: hypothetical protein VKQ72_00360 [Aggregatilineales bacterium]|nr:hypothetical protein [Aggregatilineales bacterium]